MKKAICLVLALVMALVCVTACGSNGNSGDASGDKTIIIGGSGPLTGDYATYGVSVKQGAQIAVDEINANGGVAGYKFELKPVKQ